MSYPTANELTQEMLLMKLTPSAIGRITTELFQADEQTLNTIPRYAYHHYFDEVGIAFLNWMGHGKSDDIDELLRSLSYTVFNAPDMHRLPTLTVKQHIGLHLRALSAQMTLFLKVQSTVSYSVMLTGVRNQTPRSILGVLYNSIQKHPGLTMGALSPNDIHKQVAEACETSKTSLQNILYHLGQLTVKGLLIQESSGKRLKYRLSERGLFEARYHFEQASSTNSPRPDTRKPTTSADSGRSMPPDNPHFEVATSSLTAPAPLVSQEQPEYA